MAKFPPLLSAALAALMLLASCGDEAAIPPYEADEAEKLAAEIRRFGKTPDDWVLENLEESDWVNLVDSAGYAMGLEVLKYLVPLLHSRGITDLDLWFIPRDGYAQANALLGASRFFSDSAAELCGRTGYLTLYGEQIDFLRYLYDFNRSLENGEKGVALTPLPSDGGRGVAYSLEPRGEAPRLYIQNPSAMKRFEGEGEEGLTARLEQLVPLLNAPFFIAGKDHFLWSAASHDPLLVLAAPGTIAPCRPLEGAIGRDNYETALSDFPDLVLKKPPFLAVMMMERAQRRFLRELP